MKTHTRTGRTERFETIVIGGGQAGLAVGQQLAERDEDFAILDAEDRIGDVWRRRWSSLRLFTPAAYSGLPGMPFPAAPRHLPDKDEVADYLERYAERFDLPVRSSTRVERLSRDGDRFVITTRGVTFEADNVIVATGPFQRPKIPVFARELSPSIHQLHSSEYRDPLALPNDGSALVVGAGNSGAQIALELARVRPVMLAGRNTGHLPRHVMGRDLFDWIWPMMRYATSDTSLGQRLRSKISRGDSLIGIPESTIDAAGVRRVGRVTGARDGLPVVGRQTIDARVVVWCTGFAPAYDWIDLPAFDADGAPRHRRGVATDASGLYFLGLRFQHRMTSSLIGGVGADAVFIAEQISDRTHLAAAAAA
jgi:putative flavoprotein involved in K+ transport